jgi:PP-loop superfamily ATP-utilizing enzyme
MDEVSGRLKSFGFVYVCLELEGYAMGSMNRVIARGGVEA